MRRLPVGLPVSLLLLVAGCGLSEVGPDLDAWQAHKNAIAAQDGDSTTADAVQPDGAGQDQPAVSDTGDAGAEAGIGNQSDIASDLAADAADAPADVQDADPGDAEVASDAGDDAQDMATVDAADVDAGPPCKVEADCPPGPDKCHPAKCVGAVCTYEILPCPPTGPGPCKVDLCANVTGICAVLLAQAGTPCDDNTPCTKVSVCDSAGMCSAKDNAGCDDGNPCTLDTCVAGGSGPTCSSALPDPKFCDDGNACTADSCAMGKCTNLAMTGGEACSDGNLCTENDFCAVGKCTAGPPKVCTGSTPCKPVACDPSQGCTSPTDGLPDGTPCVQPGGVCSAGVCTQGWATFIVAGPTHACAWGNNETIACWGSNKTFAVGAASIPDQATPSFSTLDKAPIASVATGNGFTCRAHAGTAKLFCRGKNDHGQLGEPASAPTAVDFAIGLFVEWTQVVAGDNHACALTTAGKAYCWGAGGAGQIGKLGQVTDSAVLLEVSFLGKFEALAAGGNNTCGLSAGEAYCWGSNGVAWGNPLANPKSGVPAPVKVAQSFVALAVGENHACGLTKVGGDVWCWGSNDSFQLGATDKAATQAKLPISSLQSVAVGDQHTCVVSTAGAVSCFGSNSKLQKGPGSKAVPDDPNFAFLTKAKAVSAAGNATCVRMANMSVQCFGVGPDGVPTLPYTVPGSMGLKLE